MPPALIPLAAAGAGAATSSLLAGTVIGALGAPGPGADALDFLGGGERAESEPREVNFFGIGPSLIVPARCEGPTAFLADFMRLHDRRGEAVANSFLEHTAAAHLEKVRAALPHGPQSFAAAFTVSGRCLGDFLADEDVAFFDDRQIMPGDAATFIVRGEAQWLKRFKFYLGSLPRCPITERLFGATRGRFYAWWQTNPAQVVLCPAADVVTHLRASHLWTGGELRRLGPLENRRWFGPDGEAVRGEVNPNPAPSQPLPEDVAAAQREMLA